MVPLIMWNLARPDFYQTKSNTNDSVKRAIHPTGDPVETGDPVGTGDPVSAGDVAFLTEDPLQGVRQGLRRNSPAGGSSVLTLEERDRKVAATM